MARRANERHGRRTRAAQVRVDALDQRELMSGLTAVPAQVNLTGAAPTIISFQRIGIHNQPTKLLLTFSQDMDPVTVQNGSNYLLAAPGPHDQFAVHNQFIRIVHAVYDVPTRTVTLTTRQPLPLANTFQLTVNGGFAGVTGANGLVLDGNNDGQPGGNASITFQASAAVPTPTRPLLPLPAPRWHRKHM